MRDRLIELSKKAHSEWLEKEYDHETDKDIDEYVADYLLANGVIVPPCKVNDKVYVISESRIEEATVIDVTVSLSIDIMLEITCDYNCEGCPFGYWTENYGGDWSCSGEYGTSMVQDKDFGKTVFLTREEAERALKGGVKQ